MSALWTPGARTGARAGGEPVTSPSASTRTVLLALSVLVALVLQTTVLPHAAWHGVVCNLVLLVVVAAGLSRGAHTGLVVGFAAGLLLDLAPPADHAAGRWALALLAVGYVAGRVRQDARPGIVGALITVAACSFLGSSVFAFSGLLLSDPARVGDLLGVVLTGVVLDVALAVLVLPLLGRLLGRAEPSDRIASARPA